MKVKLLKRIRKNWEYRFNKDYTPPTIADYDKKNKLVFLKNKNTGEISKYDSIGDAVYALAKINVGYYVIDQHYKKKDRIRVNTFYNNLPVLK